MRKVLALVDGKKRVLLVLLAIGTLVVSTLDVISVTAIFPLLKVLLDGGQALKSTPLQGIIQRIPHDELVLWGCAGLFAVFFVKVALSIWTVWLKWHIQTSIYRDVSVRLLSVYLAAPVSFHLRHNAAELQRNLNTYVSQLTQFGCMGLIDLASDLVLALGIFLALSLIEPAVSAIALVSIAIVSTLYIGIGQSFFLEWSRRFKDASGRMYRLALEAVTGIKTIKVLGREEYFVDQYRRSAAKYCETMLRNSVVAAMPRQFLELVAVGALVGIVAWAVVDGNDPATTIPVLAVFAAAAFRLMPAFIRMTNALQNFQFGHDAIETIYDHTVRLGASQVRLGSAVRKPSCAGEIILRDASFRYDGSDKPAVDKVNISIRAGEAVALVGTSGAGKTTLADIILGLHKLESGSLTIDGVEYRDPADVPRGLFGYVPQEPFLIDDTIQRNIALGLPDDEIDAGRVDAALQAAALDRFVETLPAALQTVVGERGVRLSGGQRQRIGIARAFYADPEFLVLDEATSSIDVTTEAEITEAISRLRRVKTVIVVAHRLSTVRECDRIIFMKSGKVVDEGSFQKLVEKNTDFSAMVRQAQREAPAEVILS
jgi:ATP-binding cassette subfamily C protein